ncbi:testis-specific gene 10 protein-like [Macrosteles quadrilineatus]|uniref:testis-specific gene 10 protein-like n=1 Tax=Macrosteles quadrilineatus TaxID=74068 RepID=UPI0023E25876|nr:testis-specific gene 10 protein-like [Macrosteles quadrilineatus]
MSKKIEQKSNGKIRVMSKNLEKNTPTSSLPKNKKSKLESSTDSKLPVFCHARKTHNCCVDQPGPGLKKHLSTLGRKSVSLVDLTPNTQKIKVKSRRKNEIDTNLQVESQLQISFLTNKESELAKTVCKMFILNAWRHRIKQTSSLQTLLTRLRNEVDNLKIQKSVLYELFAKGHDRLQISRREVNHLKSCLQNGRKENVRLQNENNNLKTEKIIWQNKEEEMICKMKTMKDELILTSEQNKYLRRDCDDLAKTLSECKQDNIELQDRLSNVSVCLEEKEKSLKEIQIENSNLISKTSQLEKTNDKLMEEIKNKEMKIDNLKKTKANLNVLLKVFQIICTVQNESILNLKRNLSEQRKHLKKQTKSFENLRNMVEKSEAEKEEHIKNCTLERNRVTFEAIKNSSVYLSFNNPNPEKQINPFFL